MPWVLYPGLRQDPDNARTLCRSCHSKYGAKPGFRMLKWSISPIQRHVEDCFDL